jgi:hypothetical protein
MIDTVEPNKKYYYCFRSLDIHGNISLPSSVYELEMVSEPGGQLAYPLIRVVDFADQIKPRVVKTMKRFLHVNPNEEQLMMQEGFEFNPALDNSPRLGVSSYPLFSADAGQAPTSADYKKFKIRLTSKQTGKRIDINVKFVHSHDKIFG